MKQVYKFTTSGQYKWCLDIQCSKELQAPEDILESLGYLPAGAIKGQDMTIRTYSRLNEGEIKSYHSYAAIQKMPTSEEIIVLDGIGELNRYLSEMVALMNSIKQLNSKTEIQTLEPEPAPQPKKSLLQKLLKGVN